MEALMAKAKRKAKTGRAKTRKTKRKVVAKSTSRAKARKPQRFTASHHRDEDFDYGLRAYSAYRDLGIAKATDGMVQAHVIRMTKPFSADEVAIPHYHDVEIQPPKIKHTVRGYSDDCELLEIVLPADFETVTLK
jgi:hypothetical protein